MSDARCHRSGTDFIILVICRFARCPSDPRFLMVRTSPFFVRCAIFAGGGVRNSAPAIRFRIGSVQPFLGELRILAKFWNRLGNFPFGAWSA
jgi:hypothetical protein